VANGGATTEPADREGLTEQLRRLQAGTLALAGAGTIADAADAVLRQAAPDVGASSASLWLLDRHAAALEFAGGFSFDAAIPERFGLLPLDAEVPGPIVVRTGKELVYTSIIERDERWPELVGTPSRSEAMAVFPLATDEVFGCLALGFPEARDFTDEELAVLRFLADQCAVTFDRVRRREAEQATATLLEFVLDTSTALAGSLDVNEILERFAGLVVPTLADWCAVYLPSGDVLQREILQLAAGEEDLRTTLLHRHPVRIDSTAPLAVAFRTGDLQRVPELAPDVLTAAVPDPEYLEVMAALRVRSALAIPIRCANRVHSVVTLAFTRSARMYDERLVAAATSTAERVSLAIENAELYERERTAAVTLARAILPARLPDVAGYEIAACYLPMDEGPVGVGGDWYDAFQSGDLGKVVFGIGDIAGHGVVAASLMGKLRNGARAFAAIGAQPAELVGRLNRLLLDGDSEDPFVTTIYADLEPMTGHIRWASAGHPPPLVVRDGTAWFLDGSIVPPLGGAGSASGPDNETSLAHGDLLLLYTDGVIEVRGEDLALGFDRLASAATAVEAHDLESYASNVIERATEGRRRRDDCCVLVLRRAS
jgi:serine phosphatase RsbU (regulator of sigma subunit)